MVFVSCYDPDTGENTWIKQDQDDLSWIACSGYVDMLIDHERNDAYCRAIHETILQSIASTLFDPYQTNSYSIQTNSSADNIQTNSSADTSKEVRVLDIGTGTGLLSLMANTVDANASIKVNAMELFEPMVDIARKTLMDNQCLNVTVHNMRSTETTASVLNGPSTVLVSEILDSFLLGEGLLPSILHARQHLLTPNARMVPKSARVFVRLFESDALYQFFRPHSIAPFMNGCRGTGAIELPIYFWRDHVTWLSGIQHVLHFDLENITQDMLHGHVDFDVKCPPGMCHGVVMFWELQLSDSVVLSTSPWEDEKGERWKKNQQRRHWQQAVYFFPKPHCNTDDNHNLRLNVCHNDFQIWFSYENENVSMPPVCECLFHTLFSPHELACLFSKPVSEFVSKSLRPNTTIVDTDAIPITPLLCKNQLTFHHRPNVNAPGSKKLSAKLFQSLSLPTPTPISDPTALLVSYDIFRYPPHHFSPSSFSFSSLVHLPFSKLDIHIALIRLSRLSNLHSLHTVSKFDFSHFNNLIHRFYHTYPPQTCHLVNDECEVLKKDVMSVYDETSFDSNRGKVKVSQKKTDVTWRLGNNERNGVAIMAWLKMYGKDGSWISMEPYDRCKNGCVVGSVQSVWVVPPDSGSEKDELVLCVSGDDTCLVNVHEKE